jgi:hypothetical protein
VHFDLIASILQEAFGDLRWYRSMVHLCKQLNTQSGEQRTIPNAPISGIWLTLSSRGDDQALCASNIVGPIFLLSTSSSCPGKVELCFISKKGHAYKHALMPGLVLGGTWGSLTHSYVDADGVAEEQCISWTFFLDYRVFGANYKLV